MSNYADNSQKLLSKAVPTVLSSGIVKSCDLEVTYSFPKPNYQTTGKPFIKYFPQTINVEYLNKEPQQFTKTELLSLMNLSHLDLVFDSSYESVVLPSQQSKQADFNINSLAD